MSPFENLIEERWETGEIPEIWKEAVIPFIHKPHMDEKEIKIFRPISLLNEDYKIFVTILATKLKKSFKSNNS